MILRSILFLVVLSTIAPKVFAKSEKILTFVYEDYPPYEYSTDKGLDGISASKVRSICKAIGYTPRFVFAPWSRALSLVKSGEVDGIFSLNRTSEREGYMSFTDVPVAWSEERLFSLRNKVKPIESFEQIKAKSVGVVTDYTYGKTFDELAIPKKISARGNKNLITRLNKEWIDVIVMNRIVFDYYVKKLKIDPLRFQMHPLVVNAEDLYMAFSKKSKAREKVLPQFNKMLKEMQDTKRPD